MQIAAPVLRSLIREIMSEDPSPRLQPESIIYCDMDGVLVDFAVGATTWVNELLDGGKILGAKRGKTFWKTLGKLQRELGPDWRATTRADLDLKPVRNFMFAAISANPGGFFADLLPLSDGVTELWPFLNGTGHTVKLLTAGVYGKPDVPTAEMGKQLWVEEHLKPQPTDVILTAARQKAELATSDGVPNILIDDKAATIQAWNLSGGIGILHIPGGSRGTIRRLEAIGL